MPEIRLVESATQKFLDWVAAFTYSDEDLFDRARVLATRLGAHYRPDGLTEIAFWIPDVGPTRGGYWAWSAIEHHYQVKSAKDLYLEVWTPLEPINFRAKQHQVKFRRDRLPLRHHKAYFCGVYSGMQPGDRQQAGCFYWLRYVDRNDQVCTIGDELAYSLPYGVFAPAELYDLNRLQQQRADLDYFRADPTGPRVQKVPPPQNILQLHVNTASPEGSLEGLTRIYQQIATKLSAHQPLSPAEENYIGYDAVQLLPIEPVVEYLAGDRTMPNFFSWEETPVRIPTPTSSAHPEPNPDLIVQDSPSEDIVSEDIVTVTLKNVDTVNWGYDIVIAASSATNPAVLASLRPDELVEFIATLHTFPTGPIQVIYDIVFGHTDNQSKALLNRHYLNGPNMYGQDINHQNPIVRAILLEMQRRKVNTGADGIRVDGAQDFKFLNPRTGRVEYDDAYLREMSNVIQEINGQRRKLFAIFEDGRPWPQEGWEERSTYLDVIQKQPEVYQWGPLIFAHNTPTLVDFWDRKWRRVCEVMDHGAHWITGCGNHDTMRRGTQVSPTANINWNLGHTLPEVIRHAYDNPAVALLFYGFSPGVPMDFLNATMRSPWCFFRNTDDQYGLKVIAEEVGFLDWQVGAPLFDQPELFQRVKDLGFQTFTDLRDFMGWLNETVTTLNHDYSLTVLAERCQTCWPDHRNHPLVTVQTLQHFARAYMEDCHDICNITHHRSRLNAQQTHFNLRLRQYRRARPWLSQNLTPADTFARLEADSATVFYGHRSRPQSVTAPDALGESQQPEQLIAITHMGGDPCAIALESLLPIQVSQWQIALASPGLTSPEQPFNLEKFVLKDSQGLLLTPKLTPKQLALEQKGD